MSFRAYLALGFSVAMLGASPSPAPSGVPPLRLSFVAHAAFFSVMSRQSTLVDPDIFIADASAPAALGFEQIAHVAGERNASMNDDATARALDANARALGFDLQHWYAANGVVELDAPDPGRGGAQTIVTRFANLVPRARYSLFVAHLEGKAAAFGALDLSGKTNSFTTDGDGTAGITVVSPQTLPHGSAILLVYHADKKDHGMKAGNLGFDAFHQLVVRVP